SRDLETICMKCLNKEASRRYPSAQALAEDLERCRKGETILARRTSIMERGYKWARRRPAAAALYAITSAIFLGITVGGAVLEHSWRVGESNRNKRVWTLTEEEHSLGVAAREAVSRDDLAQVELKLSNFLGRLDDVRDRNFLAAGAKASLELVQRRLREME